MVRLSSFFPALAGLVAGAWASSKARQASGPVAFLVDQFTTHNARQGDAFEANISGLLDPAAAPALTFSIHAASGDSWATLSADGVISGTPGRSAGDTRLVIKASSSSDDSSDELEVLIPVRSSDKPLVRRLSVMTYNLWYGGTQVNDYHAKQVRYLVKSGVDIVGFQESFDGAGTRLAKALGWHSWQGRDVSIISRYPIVRTSDDLGYAGYARIALDGDKSQVNVWNVHLAPYPYGPYDVCFDRRSIEDVVNREAESGRVPQLLSVLDLMKEELDNSDEVPVILVGDFNAPSHLDYTEGRREANCGYANIPWPTSVHPTNAGLIDSFRVAHPDPVKRPGITWSPIYLDNEGRPEPLDRIDFIYHKGNMTVSRSDDIVVGKPKPQPYHQNNLWTSDHASVLTEYYLGSCKPRHQSEWDAGLEL